MLVLSNRRLGAAAELRVSPAIGSALLVDVADAARPVAAAHWEHELVRWLDEQAARLATTRLAELPLDVSDIAFTPRHFERQRAFLVDAIRRACARSEHPRALACWADLIEAHPSDSVQIGRRWIWHSTA